MRGRVDSGEVRCTRHHWQPEPAVAKGETDGARGVAMTGEKSVDNTQRKLTYEFSYCLHT